MYTLFVSFLCIKLVRFADRQPDRKLPVPVFFILDEFPNSVIRSAVKNRDTDKAAA